MRSMASSAAPRLEQPGIFVDFVAATLTAKAFDSVTPGLGKWLVTVAVWLFALSTMISWSYYGEQGIIFMFGERMVLPYKVIYCMLIIVATVGFIEAQPGAVNVIAGATRFSVDLRSSADAICEERAEVLAATFNEIAARRGVSVAAESGFVASLITMNSPPWVFLVRRSGGA